MESPKAPAFTLLEMMVVVAIVGLLATLTIRIFSWMRSSARDSARVMHVTQIQTALRAYYRDSGVYPTTLVAGQSLISGTITYMDELPIYPQPVDGNCPSDAAYDYTQLNSGASYQLDFCLGDETGDLPPGFNRATPAGIIVRP